MNLECFSTPGYFSVLFKFVIFVIITLRPRSVKLSLCIIKTTLLICGEFILAFIITSVLKPFKKGPYYGILVVISWFLGAHFLYAHFYMVEVRF